MADGKWIEGLTPDLPPADAARLALAARLGAVGERLPGVLHDAASDPEHVHQLRVATRRADAAVKLFADCLPQKSFKATRRRLRSLRRAAGEARDWDVFALALAEREAKKPAAERAGLDFLLGLAFGNSAVALERLIGVIEKKQCRLEALAGETVGAVRAPASGPTHLANLARPTLEALRNELEQTAAGDLKDYDRLHQVRIAGKRLRYAMELFADCFDPDFKGRLYPRIEEMQEILGLANDSHVAGQRLAGVRDWLKCGWAGEWKRLRPGVEGLLKYHQRRLPQERRRFLGWWKRWQGEGAELFRELVV